MVALSLPFKLVHTGLAVGFFMLVYWVWDFARRVRTGHQDVENAAPSGV